MSELSTGEIQTPTTNEALPEEQNFTPFTEEEMKNIFDQLQQSPTESPVHSSDNDFLKAAELMATIHENSPNTDTNEVIPNVSGQTEHKSSLQKILQSISRFFKKIFGQ